MSKRLVKIAKELNVGTTTIVEHLLESGFEIENKPTAKISEDMYNELLKQFSGSIAVKEKADQLILGGRTSRAEEEAQERAAKKEEAQEKAAKKEEEQKPAAETAKEEAAPEKEKEEAVENVKLADEDKPKLKVVGKIDLDKKKADGEPDKEAKAAGDEEKPAEDEEKAAGDEEKAAEESKPAAESDEEAPGAGKEEDDDIVRAEAPQLKGLKIMGKVDPSKLRPKAKKSEDKDSDKTKRRAEASSDSSKRKRRKRKRRKVMPSDLRRDSRRDRRGGRDDVKEVSSKEIEEKIKATMARLSSGGKSKRQKIRRESRDKKQERQEMLEAQSESKALELTEFVSVSELASLMNVPVADVITTCMNLGVIVSINQRLDAEIIELVAEEFGNEVNFISAEEQIMEVEEEEDDPEDLEPRAPIVTVMGHVDHGKTSLLDYIRAANVVSGEAGGITQHIGAYEVVAGENQDKRITFLDTPGHEAFTAMRARGAKVTDVVVIIIAADDNVMPQTKEAISHAQAAGVPIVFAINKIDKPGADPERIKQELGNMNFLVEEWGGKYQSQDISAKSGQNVDLLLEKIILEADLLELMANPDKAASGTVIEASLDKGRGYVTKLLIQNGTLNIGDTIVAGEHSGRIKAMFNERGKKIKKAGPSKPVLVLGMDGAPQAGEVFREMESDQDARRLAAQRAQIAREQTTRASKRVSLDEIGRRLALGTFKELNLIVKGDVDGSVEALSDALIKQTIETVKVNVIHKAVGGIVESDILLASASDAIIIGFQVRPSLGARKLAEKEGVEIKTYSVIYEAIEEVRMAIEGMLEPTREERITGQVEVRETYKISRIGTIAGCYVQEGKITRNSHIRVIRDGIVVYPTKEGVVGEVSSLKRFKDDVREVKAGLECGVTIKNYNDVKVGDFIETYEVEMIKQTLDD
jgi:translation initiation factor IF-2